MIRRSTLITLLLLAVLVGLVFFLQHQKNTKENAEPSSTESSSLLFEFTSEINSFRLDKVGGNVIEFTKDAAGAWVMTGEPATAIDSTAVDSALSQLLSTRVLSSLQDSPSLEDAGLEPPVYRLLLILSDGKQERVSIGDVTPTGSGFYLQMGARGLMVVNKYSLEPILEFADNPPIILIPTPSPSSLSPTPGESLQENGAESTQTP